MNTCQQKKKTLKELQKQIYEILLRLLLKKSTITLKHKQKKQTNNERISFDRSEIFNTVTVFVLSQKKSSWKYVKLSTQFND